jgi:hypothetical protein
MNFNSFFSDFCAALLSGFALALIFFLFREWWHPLPRVSGQWFIETHVEKSTYSHYSELRLKYVAMLSQQGSRVTGTIEKIFEQNSDESFEYQNEKRIHGELKGYIDRFYLRSNRLSFHIVEHGRSRDSSVVFELTAKKGELSGIFHSTAASATGKAIWSRSQDSNSFSDVIRYEKIVPKGPGGVVA